MNYYERHLGDYARDTAHLSMLEHGAYSLLLDRYYATEAPIPDDQVHRLARARSPEEIAAVDAVLAEFFVRVDGAWVNHRAEREVAKYLETEPEREAKRANATERQRRARARRKDLFDALREHGLVPAYDTHTNELEAMLSRVTSPPVTRDTPVTAQPVTRNDTVAQPHTHTPIEDQKHSCPKPAASDPAPAAASKAERLAAVTEDAIETFNESPFTVAHGGRIPNVTKVNREKRRQQVAKAIGVVREICAEEFGTPAITRDFWVGYWAIVNADPFASGRQPGTGAHANWRPSFEYLVRPDTITSLYERAEASA